MGVGALEIENPSFIWLAHTPNLFAKASQPTRYRIADYKGMSILIPEGDMTISGLVHTPEAGIVANMGVETEKVQREVRIPHGIDPYEVVMGMSNGTKQTYKNAPQVDIKLL